MARTEVSRRPRREEVYLVNEGDNPTIPPLPDNYFYYFAYGHNMWRDEMKHCITPKAKLIGVAYLPGHKWFLTTRHRANVIEVTQEERDTLPKHQRRVYGLVWAVPYGDNEHLRRDYTADADAADRLNTRVSERLDRMECARLTDNGKRAKSSHYKSEAAEVTFVTVPELDGERRRYIDDIGGYPQGDVTARIYIDRSRVKNYNIILPHYRLIMNMGFADFLNLYHEKRYVDNLRGLVPVFLPDKLYPVMNRDYYKLLEQMSAMLDIDENLDLDDRRSSIYQQPDQNERDEAATVSSRGFITNRVDDEVDSQEESAYTRAPSGAVKSHVTRHSRHYGKEEDDYDDDDQSEQSRRTRRARTVRHSSRRDDDEYDDGESRYRRDDDDDYDDDEKSQQTRRTYRTRMTRRGQEDDDDYDDDRTEQSERRDRGGRDRRAGARSTVTRAPTAVSDASEYELVLAEVASKGGKGGDRRSTKPRRMAKLDEYSELDEEESLLLIQQQEVRKTLDIRELPSRSRRDREKRGDRDEVKSDMARSVYQPPNRRKIVVRYE